MSKFIDGPAKGQNLTLGSSPYFLRAVKDPRGKWDALDKLDDEPALEEEIHVYRLVSEPITAHVDGRNPTTGKRYGKWMSIADYALHSEQPDDATARNKAAWQEWCAARSLTSPPLPPTTGSLMPNYQPTPI
jgi:hypothetical protein